jgi:hypothetical protein
MNQQHDSMSEELKYSPVSKSSIHHSPIYYELGRPWIHHSPNILFLNSPHQ